MDRYLLGVPCWVDTTQADPDAAAEFYAALFGWELEDQMPADAGGRYLIARLDGKDAAAISSGTPPAAWNSYVLVESADAAAERVEQAGGTVVLGPLDAHEAGRMAIIPDPEGAELYLWEPRSRRGADVVNSHGSVNFNDLFVEDLDRAKAFYNAVFGWETIEMGPTSLSWTRPGYGDRLEELFPGTRERNASYGAPPGFEDVVASVQTTDGEARWGVTFGIDDVDAAAATAAEHGGRVVEAPADAPWTRSAVIADPAGATFVLSQFKPENR